MCAAESTSERGGLGEARMGGFGLTCSWLVAVVAALQEVQI